MNKKEYKKKLDEKMSLVTTALNEKDHAKALAAINEQLDYVKQISDEVDNSKFVKWLNDSTEAHKKADQINSIKKTPFMMKLKDLSLAIFVTMWVALIMSVIMIFVGFRPGLGIIITFWCSYLFYYGIQGYLDFTFKVKFPKIKRKDKKAGLLLFEEEKQELDIAVTMDKFYKDYKFYEENHE